MAVKGPQELGFLYNDFLSTLFQASTADYPADNDLVSLSKTLVAPKGDLITQRTVASPMSSIYDLDHESYLILRAGYYSADSSQRESSLNEASELKLFQQQFTNKVAENITSEDSIFVEFFKKIEENLKTLKQKHHNSSESELIHQARIKTLIDYKDKFEQMGAYYAENSKYYFDPSSKTTDQLSSYFVKKIYNSAIHSTLLLDAQRKKHENQVNGKKEALKQQILSTGYHFEFDELKDFEDDLDLLLASPSIINMNSNQQLGKLPLAFIQTEVSDSIKKKEKLITADERERTALYVAKKYIGELNSLLNNQAGILGISLDEIKIHQELNSIELIYSTKKQIKKIINQLELKAFQLDREMKLEKNNIKKSAEKIIETEYNLKIGKVKEQEKRNYPNIFDHTVKLNNLDSIYLSLEESKQNVQETVDTIKQVFENKISFFKRIFIADQIKTAKGFAKAYREYSDAQKEFLTFEKSGGSFSCLSFVPLRIDMGNTEKNICLISLSGVDSNTHTILEDFTKKQCSSCNINGEEYEFHYISNAADQLDLILMQIGKGLSGTNRALNSQQDSLTLPDFNKTCAEKKLTTKLAELFESHGDNLSVLGCDNIALPIYTQILKQDKKAKQKKIKSQQFQLSGKVLRDDIEENIDLTFEKITCCRACQNQKPAVFTYLYNAQNKGKGPVHTQVTPDSSNSCIPKKIY